MITKRHLLRAILLFDVMMLSSSMQLMAQKYDFHKVMLAAEKQNKDFEMGVKLAFGEAKKYKEAIPLFEKAANSGIPIAMFTAGLCYLQLNDDKKAVEWFLKGAQKGDASAQSILGSCYEDGDGVEVDMQKAVMWYTKAAVQGLDDAQYSLAL